PDAPGTATFNAATRELTIPAMPGHTSFLRAKRQPAGGPESDAGVSNDTTVSVVGISPLTPGVSYQVWVVGVNSRGEGPESNKITFVA
ncbi:MAG TPA: fibronectin type III domain-containing protein, partial [Pyrinomonadaceae bacterium]